MRNKKGNAVVIFLAIALVISVSAAGYLFWQNKQLQNQTVKIIPPVQAPSPVPTIDPTASWKTYTNMRYKFTFNYPSQWIENNNSESALVYFTMQQNDRPINVLLIINAYQATSFENWIQSKSVVNRYTSGNQNEVSYKDFLLGNIKSYEMINYPSEGGCTRIFAVYHNGNVFEIEKGGGTCNMPEKTFDQILSTFKFL